MPNVVESIISAAGTATTAPVPTMPGFTWVPGVLTDGVWIPGHWVRAGTAPSTTPPVVVDHSAEPEDSDYYRQIVLQQNVPSTIWGYSVPRNDGKEYGDAGLSQAEIDFVHGMSEVDGKPRFDNAICEHTEAGLYPNPVGGHTFELHVKPRLALQLRESGISPHKWWIDSWVADVKGKRERDAAAEAARAAADAAAKAAADAAAAAAKTKTLTTTARPPTSSSSMGLLLALAAAVVYFLMACRNDPMTTCTPPIVLKRTLTIPAITEAANVIRGVSVGGTSQLGAYVNLLAGPGNSAQTDAAQAFPVTSALRRLSIARQYNGHPLTAITLAPDSPVSTFDIWTKTDGTVEAYRCDIQNPIMYPDWMDATDLFISSPNLVPLGNSNFSPIMWDGQPLTDINISNQWASSIRYNLWYGAVPHAVPAGRAMLHARARYRSTQNTPAAWFVPVEGRRRIKWDAETTSATATMVVTAISTFENSAGTGLDNVRNFTLTTQLLAANASNATVYDLSNAHIPGIPLLKFELTDTIAVPPSVFVDVWAFDY